MLNLTYSTKRNPTRLKSVMCRHCKQLTMFEDCLVSFEYYDWFVCWDCIRLLYTPCEGCQNYYLSNDCNNLRILHDESGKVCKKCIADGLYTVCRDCRKVYPEEECEYHTSVRGYVCKECLQANYLQCNYCEQYYRSRDVVSDGRGNHRCDDCAGVAVQCSRCSSFLSPENAENIAGGFYCRYCVEECFRYCHYCEGIFSRDDLLYYNDTYYCYNCGGEHDLPLFPADGRLIRGYDYKPIPTFFKTPTDKHEKLFFGVELEVGNTKGRIENEDMVKKLFKVFKNFAYYKRDGSVPGGFEIVTHPFSWVWYRENRKMFEAALELLRKNGFRSYEPGMCGIHVHMSRKAFTDVHLFKFLKFFFENHDFMYIISQRDDYSTRRSCQWGRRRDRKDQKTLLKKTKEKGTGVHGNRFTAVNLESPGTYEVRIFRGTLKASSFMKNVEFCKAAYDFTDSSGISHIKIPEFKQYVSDRQKVFSNLFEFMVKKELL